MNDSQAAPCAFCEIIAGREPAHVVRTDENAIAFLDRNPIAPGHLLVVPRQRARTLGEFTEAEYLDLMILARSLAGPPRQAVGADRAAMAVEGYGVADAHIHLVPVHGPGQLDANRQPPATEDGLAPTAHALQAVLTNLPGQHDFHP